MSTRLRSWGNYPAFTQTSIRCYWRDELVTQFELAQQSQNTLLPYGAGLSYGDCCLASSDHVLHMRGLDRFIQVDWTTGKLTAETGVTLEEILAVCIPQGWFLAVTPGTKYVTLGGAIANDVHGKNHHKQGTFGRHVLQFGLLRSDTGRQVCTPDQLLFHATIGGLGLTGIIEWAQIQLLPIVASQIDCLTQRFNHLDEFFALSHELDAKHEFCVAWIDCLARGKALGRGVYMAGDFKSQGGLVVENPRKHTFPGTPPLSLVNRLSVQLFNQLYWHKAPKQRQHHVMGYNKFFYPLDALLKWNRIYGIKGFQQYQCLIPESEAHDGIQALLTTISNSDLGSFLAVLKRCGNIESPGLLSFPKPGFTLALDFPQSPQLTVLLPKLDAIVREANGRIYPAKDAHMLGEDFRQAYPAWPQVEALRDPALLSRFWRRVTQ